ncbi:MAG: BTAD domain-containing putative transcriptional regulator, partial [Longimicrobiales bacterium]
AGSRRPVSRDRIIGLLWEEADTERARKLLSESLYVIRKALGDEALIASGDDVRLNPDVVWCDVVEFHAALERKDVAAAVDIYGGPFLDGFFVSDAPEFEKWVDGVRDTLARTRADALSSLAAAADSAGDLAGAAAWWRKLAEQDPYNATYALGLIRALERTGERAAGLQHARIHAALLRSEFDADPDPAIAALAQQLKDAPAGVPVVRRRDAPAGTVTDAAAEVRKPIDAPRASIAEDDVALKRLQSLISAPSRPRRGLAVSVAAIVVIAAAFAFYRSRGSVTPAPARVSFVAVFPFGARGANADLREDLMELLSWNLDGAGDLRTVDSHALLAALSGEKTVVAPARGATIANSYDAEFFVIGDVIPVGQQVHIRATLYRSADGAVVKTAAARGSADSVFVLVDSIAMQLVAARGVSPDDLTRLAALMTSYPAYKAYMEGERSYRAGRYEEAAGSFSHAIAIDPTFALADYRLSAASEWSFDFGGARRAAARALENSERLPERYRPLLRAWLYFLNGNAEAGQREYSAILTNYPSDIEARSGIGEILVHFNPTLGLSGNQARAAFERVLAIAPATGETRYHAMEFAARDGNKLRFDSLLATLEPDNRQYLAWRAVRAYTWGTAAHQAATLQKLAGAEELQIGVAAGRVAAHTHNLNGAFTIARELTRAGRTDDWRAGGHLISAEILMARGRQLEAEREIAAAAPLEQDWTIELESLILLHPLSIATADDLRRQQAKLLTWNPGSHTPSMAFFFGAHAAEHARLRAYLLGLISTRLQDYKGADEYRRSLEQLSGTTESQQFGVALSQSLAGHIALAKGDTTQALERLTGATVEAPPEFLALSPFYSRAHDRFVIGDINAALGRTKEAQRWYESLLEGYDFMYAAAAHDRLAMLAARTGDAEGARIHAAKFAELRK